MGSDRPVFFVWYFLFDVMGAVFCVCPPFLSFGPLLAAALSGAAAVGQVCHEGVPARAELATPNRQPKEKKNCFGV